MNYLTLLLGIDIFVWAVLTMKLARENATSAVYLAGAMAITHGIGLVIVS